MGITTQIMSQFYVNEAYFYAKHSIIILLF